MEIQKIVEYAKALKPEDMEWKPLYPNNMPGNGLMGYAAYLELPDGSGASTILFSSSTKRMKEAVCWRKWSCMYSLNVFAPALIPL